MRRFRRRNSAPHGAWPDVILSLLVPLAAALAVEVTLPPNPPGPLLFARDEINRATASKPAGPDAAIEVTGSGEPQGYRLERNGARWCVRGADAVGAMYGGLELAEAVRSGTLAQLKPGDRKPYVAQRGLKFNIPLDLRTPSYSDNSDAAQANISEMWSREFWRAFLDEMARHRFNVLTLWSLNPFPSIVKVPEYPDVALNDVLRGRREVFDDSFPHSGKNMFKPEFLKDAEVVRRMTIRTIPARSISVTSTPWPICTA